MTEAHRPPPAPLPARAWLLDGRGGIAPAAGGDMPAPPERGFVLVLGSPDDADFSAWIDAQTEPDIATMLSSAKARSRCTVIDDRVVLVLRLGGEHAEGRQPVAMLVEKHRVIVSARMDVTGFLGVEQWARSRHAPLTPIDFVVRLGLRAADRMEPLIEKVSDGLDSLEHKLMGTTAPDIRQRLGELRRTIITLRRVIWPQRDALDTIEIEDVSFLTDKDRIRLREATTRFERLENELRALAERSGLIHEGLMDARAEQMNRIILVLTAVTVVFTPLTLISGLLGMNVGGIPFADAPWAFWAVLGVLVTIALAIVVWMRTHRWL